MTTPLLRASLAALVALVAAPSPVHALGGPAPGAVSAQTVKLPSGPGSVRGLADDAVVNAFTGQVDTAVPIELPSGVAGLTPPLSLVYAGELGNGPLGVGWTLPVPSIRRSLRHGVPAFDATDTLELVGTAGGELVAIAPGVYRLEGQGHGYDIVADGDGFVVRDPDGVAYRYGTTPAARKGGSAASAWYLEEIRDVAGQTITYTYRRDRGEVYLDAIAWGPPHGGAPAFRAELRYEARADAVVSYRTGARVETAERVRAIEIRAFGQPLRTVTLRYDESFALSRLAGVTVTGGGDALPPLAFSYAAAVAPELRSVPGVDGWTLGSAGTSLFDVDADGVMDLLRLRSSGHSWRRNLGASFAPPVAMIGAPGAALDRVRLVDLDGDATAEMVWQQGSQWTVFRVAGAAWTDAGRWPGTSGVPMGGVALADLDGDSRMDALQVSGRSMNVRMGGDAGLGPAVRVPGIDAGREFIYPGAASTSFPDVNGDGLADVAYLGASTLYLYLGTGDGRFERYRDIPYPWSGIVDPSQVRLGDLDRDGLLDVLVVRAGHVSWYRGLVGGLAAAPVELPRPPGTDAGVVVALADGNGNGSEDVVWSAPEGMWLVDLAGPTSAGMLVAIDNGLGQTQAFTYQASAQLALADEAAGAPWSTRLPVSIPVAVRQAVTLASAQPERSTRLDVRDGVYAASERRFIGFSETVTSRPDPADADEPAQVVRRVQRFHPGLGVDRVLRGQVVLDRIEDATGRVYRVETRDLAALTVAGLDPGQPLLRRAGALAVEAQHFEGSAQPVRTRTEYGHDAEGRVTVETSWGRLDLAGDEHAVERRYTEGRSSRGVRDRVCEEWRHGAVSDGPLVGHSQTLFGDDASTSPLCDAGAGWPRVVRDYLASPDGGRWIDRETARYDAHGNAIEKVAAGVTRTLTYDDRALRVVAEVVSPGGGAPALRWEASWDEVLGQPTRVRDASGAVAVATYDGLGRLRSVAREGALAHSHQRYGWSGPRPYVESFAFDGDPDGVTALPATWTPASQWRHTVAVFDSSGAPLFGATRLAEGRWIIEERRQRDALGRTVGIAAPFEWQGDLAGLVSGDVPVGDAVQTLAYDGLDRPVVQTLPGGARTTFAYRAFETTTTTDGMAPVTTVLDGQGRIRRTSRTVGGVDESVEATHDGAGRITSMTVGAGVVHRFTYDTLGRMVFATDPDIGDRHLDYDDAGRLIAHTNGAGQTTAYTYDGAGRLASSSGAGGIAFRYHYDQPQGDGFAYTGGRLAWVEEPTGRTELGYDAFGRTARVRRVIDGHVADERLSFAPSGLERGVAHDDGVSIAYHHDAAGRIVAVSGPGGELWRIDAQDAAGRILAEHFGNGIAQSAERDLLGQATRIRIARGDQALYDASVAYNAFGGVASIADGDGHGLDHTAAFTYDGGARLTDAVLGAAAAPYRFSYRYDGLQNMVRRDVSGPGAPGALTGDYRYGETTASGPRGPRQLTSVVADDGAITTFDYDAAGRTVRQGGLSLDYNGFDQLVRVRGLPDGTALHAYGHDGQRVRTVDPAGRVQIWFSPSSTLTAGVREHYVRVGDRLIARLQAAPGMASGHALGRGLRVGLAGLSLLVLAASLATGRRSRRIRATAALLVVLVTACGPATTSSPSALSTAPGALYYQHAIGAGPTLITRADGSILEERRYEPFGEELDAYSEDGEGTGSIGAIDPTADTHNVLGKPTDAATGWSYHGARWLAPETGRWLTPDPPVKAPDPAYMASPWSLHPYQYVNQNPVLFWDPDGKETKQQRWLAHFETHYARYKGIGRVHGTHDDGVLTETGVRVPAYDGDFLAARPYYDNQKAAFVAWQGYVHYAELIEAGHYAAALKIHDALGRMPRDDELDLYEYTGWSRRANDARTTIEVSVTIGEAAVTLRAALASNPLAGTRYTGKVRQQMRPRPGSALPDNHGFPLEVDNFAQYGTSKPITGGDGIVRTKIELPGSYKGKQGHFEWIIENDGTVNHRLFVPDKPD